MENETLSKVVSKPREFTLFPRGINRHPDVDTGEGDPLDFITEDGLISSNGSADDPALGGEPASKTAAAPSITNNPITPSSEPVHEEGSEDSEVKADKAKVEGSSEEPTEIEETPLIQDYMNRVGVQILDDSGRPKVYEDNYEGFMAYNSDVLAHREKEAQNSLLSKFPLVKKALEFSINEPNGRIEDFVARIQRVDYSNAVLTEEDKKDPAKMKAYMRELYLRKELSSDVVDTMIEALEKGDKLISTGEAAFKELQKMDSTLKATREKEAAEHRARLEAEQATYWSQVTDIVKKGKVQQYIIPEADRTKFLEYISKDVTGKGESQEMLDQAKETLDTAIAVAFLRYKKFDLSTLIKEAAGTMNAKSLKDKWNAKNKSIPGTSKPSIIKDTDISIDNV